MLQVPAVAEVPVAIAARGEVLITTAHAVGAQVYECKFDSDGKLAWQFREPIATLFIAGKTVGRHYAGPNWEMTDGSAVSGKVAAQSPGDAPNDIPLLKLEADAMARHRTAQPHHNDSKAQHPRRPRRSAVRLGRHIPECAVHGGLRVLQKNA